MDSDGIRKINALNWLLAGLEADNFVDFEDCLQAECAKAYGAEYIVTRNIEDYKASEVKVILPGDYLEQIHPKIS